MIGDVETLDPALPATVSTSIDEEQNIVYFNFGIPQGVKGDTGDVNLVNFEVENGVLKAYDEEGHIYYLGIVAMEPKGEYSATTSYEKLNTVLYNDSTYMALKSSTGVLPTDTEYWQLIGGGVTKEYLEQQTVDNLDSTSTTRPLSANQGNNLNKNKIEVFDTVALMKAANLKNGMTTQTLGYYEANDGGGANYKIVSVESGTEYQEELDNGLYATLIVNNYVTPEMFGAKGDGSTDDSDYIQTALNKSKNVYLFNKTYLVSKTITLPTNSNLIGTGLSTNIKSTINNGTAIFKNTESIFHGNIKNLYINAQDLNSKGISLYRPYDNCTIENIYFNGFTKNCIEIGRDNTNISQSVIINNCMCHMSNTATVSDNVIYLNKCYEFNLLNNKFIFGQNNHSTVSCCLFKDIYDLNFQGNSLFGSNRCGIELIGACRYNRIISNTYEDITSDYLIILGQTDTTEITQTLIFEAGTYFNAPKVVYCGSNENKGFFIGLESTGGARNLALNVNSSKVQTATGNGFLTVDNKALSMSAVGLQGYNGQMRYRMAVNDSESADYGMNITDSRNPTYKKEIRKSYEGNTKPGYRIKFVSPDGNTTKYVGINNSGALEVYDGTVS